MGLNIDTIEGVIWDLDNTLYRFTDKFIKSCNVAAAKAAQDLGLNFTYEETVKIAEKSEAEYGYSMHIYITDHGLSYQDLHVPFHQNIDETVIQPIEKTAQALDKFKGRQAIVTNASRCWAQRVLKYLNLDDVFKYHEIIPMEDVNYEPKARSDKGFIRAAEILRLPPDRLLMVDDLDRNLIIPHKMGMQTAYMYHNDPMVELPEFVSIQSENLVSLMEVF
ncbi:MAG TPA: HAD hydrolase-like protein [Alphaproteobacteria bacterium]|nr:HAD hydrolase-like protein [Alphaproteobacteria bacterium]